MGTTICRPTRRSDASPLPCPARIGRAQQFPAGAEGAAKPNCVRARVPVRANARNARFGILRPSMPDSLRRVRHPCSIALVLVAALLASCTITPRQAAIARELAKAVTVASFQVVLCQRIERHYDIEGGYFDVPQRSCKYSKAPNGNLVFEFSGTGHFSKMAGLATGDFQQAVKLEFQMRLANTGYIYLLPEGVEVAEPTVYNLQGLAAVAEIGGVTSRKVRRTVTETVGTPKTIIPSLQGRMCIVDGWIPPDAIPTECSGDQGFAPVGGNYLALKTAPVGWELAPSAGLNVTEALTPSAIPPAATVATEAAPSVSPEESPRRPLQAAAPSEIDSQARSDKGASQSPKTEAPEQVAEIATPPAKPVRTWAQRAEGPTRDFLVRNSAILASSIQGITHPTGKSPALAGFEVRGEGDQLTVDIEVNWKGGFLKSAYRTRVRWTLNAGGHERAAVVSDTAMIAVAASNAAALERYFRDSVFPQLRVGP